MKVTKRMLLAASRAEKEHYGIRDGETWRSCFTSAFLVKLFNAMYEEGMKELGDETITITKEEYEHLVENDKFMDALEIAGVEDWHGYDYALDIFSEE